MPIPAFVEYANFLIDKGRTMVFQNLVISLDLSTVDIVSSPFVSAIKGFVYELCLDKRIYLPLIYACPRLQDDFITPLNKFFSHWEETKSPETLNNAFLFIELT
jgi:hypothetical protein